MTWGMIHEKFKRLCAASVFFFVVVLLVLMTFSSAQARVVEGKVTSIHGDLVELNLGSEKGIKLGDSGRIFYKITIGEKERQIFIAKFKITFLSEKSSMAQIEERTADLKVGYLAEMAVKGGELEVRSEPPGARIYVDGKEIGESPVVLSGISPGRHLIRVMKEGYDAYEILEITGADRKEVIAHLKKVVKEGELVIRTEPSAASVYLNGRLVGTSPYEGKGLTAGKYKVRVTKEGYENWEKTEILEPGKRVEVLSQLSQLKPKEGDLEIRSEPSEGKVYVDGKYMGETPLTLTRIRPGQYLVLVVKEGYYPQEERVEMKGAERKRIHASLKSRAGELEVTLTTPGAKLVLDGKPVEVGSNNHAEKELPAGSYKLKAMREGFETWEGDVTVKAGERVEVSIELKMKRGELLIRTEPPGALIYLAGKSVGAGSYEEKGLVPGSYRIRIAKEDYEAWEGDAMVEPGKRAEIIARLKEIDWAQRSCEAPTWKRGDSWTYRDAAGRVWSNTVEEIKEDSFIMRIGGDRDLYAFDKKTLNSNYIIDRTGRKVKNKDPFRNIFDFALFVGKKWRYSTESGGTNFVNEFKVEGVEEVNTAAGTFKAYNIYFRQSETSRMASGRIRYWYAPAVKSWIKREVEKSAYWARAYGLQNAELYSYTLK